MYVTRAGRSPVTCDSEEGAGEDGRMVIAAAAGGWWAEHAADMQDGVIVLEQGS